MPTDQFNLRVLIREVAESSTLPDPGQLADEVFRRISSKQRAEALAQALPSIVHSVVSQARHPIPHSGHSPDGSHPSLAAAGPTSEAFQPRTSRKVTGIRDTWQRVLRDRIAVGPDRADWKFLGECTAVDLAYAAQIREDMARRNADRAAQFRGLAERMERAGVQTVGQLSRDDLGDVLGAAA